MFYNRWDIFLKKSAGKRIAFIGIGLSNFDLILLFLKNGFNVTILDKKNKDELDNKKVEMFEFLGAGFICGEDYLDNISSFDIVIRSPGVYFNNYKIQKAIKKGTIVTSELELFFDFCPCKIIAVTGSDGKTTTTTLIAKILEEEGFKVHLGGNLGIAILKNIEDIKQEDFAVVELSSFQLISMRKSADISIITNISMNHLDVHSSMKEYIDAKKNIFIHQNAFSELILNLDNNICSSMQEYARGFVKKFSMKKKVKNGAFFDEANGNLYYSKNGQFKKVINSNDISLLGKHNIENFLAAIAATYEFVKISSIEKVAKNFKGVKHRLELIKKENSISWYNDSIATSPTRTIAALNAFEKNIILIAGGYDKNLPFDELSDKILEKVKALILIGNTANKIESAVKRNKNYYSSFNMFIKTSLAKAVKKAKKLARPGDIVLLSPACASFPTYKNFEARGEDFVKNVLE